MNQKPFKRARVSDVVRAMKFQDAKYWKHERATDVFFCVSYIDIQHFNGCVILDGTWCSQGTEAWWFTAPEKIQITTDQYDMWHPYRPKGVPKL